MQKTHLNRILIFANGTLHLQFIRTVTDSDYVIGVDRAAYWLIKHNIIPDLAIGDFDSTNENELASIQHYCKNIRKFAADKDYTDTELAIQEALKLYPNEIILFGSTGNRIDHVLANIHLLEVMNAHGITASIRDISNEIYCVTQHLVFQRNALPYVSLVPITDSACVTLHNFKFDIDRQTIKRGETIGISNEIIKDPADITVHTGAVFVIRSAD